MRAKLYPLNRTVGPFKCKKPRCEVCVNITETDIFTSTVTGESFKINHSFDCDDKCLIYLLRCNQCKKKYVGQNVDNFRFRWSSYKCSFRKNGQGQGQVVKQHLYDHFTH